MKAIIFCLTIALISVSGYCQISFEKGYFIDNNNQRVECLIKNMDWKNNPAEFEYKFTPEGKPFKGNLSTAKEFGITGFSKYKRVNTKIDTSPTETDKLSGDRNPEWSQAEFFLKVLIEGKANLYYYEDKNMTRFFYSVSDTLVNQLIYKEYYTSDNQVAQNFKFREQLWMDVRLPDARLNSVENIRYFESDFKRYFKTYNEGQGYTYVIYGLKKHRDSFHLRITPGLNYSWASVASADNPTSYTDLGSQINFRIGVESELILPFNKNKWGIIFDPSYQYFNSSGQNGSNTIDIHYQSIEFPLGLRHYFFLNDNLKIFVNGVFILANSITFNSTISNLDIVTGNSYALGCGLGYKKISAEMRYSTNRDLLKSYISLYNDYRRFSLILGFRVL